ncbi:uncharacterized protein LOC124098355 isoform X2 [Marmota monax]|uniref:uncharacterized protein LOC124098355 isoform X2 n=1 Tax=Marmota monax TaxID=9995 RepID=UPI0026F20337|nr:uncharacterized protein LOC124098355 isoform X2 [Marmota monax]
MSVDQIIIKRILGRKLRNDLLFRKDRMTPIPMFSEKDVNYPFMIVHNLVIDLDLVKDLDLDIYLRLKQLFVPRVKAPFCCEFRAMLQPFLHSCVVGGCMDAVDCIFQSEDWFAGPRQPIRFPEDGQLPNGRPKTGDRTCRFDTSAPSVPSAPPYQGGGMTGVNIKDEQTT